MDQLDLIVDVTEAAELGEAAAIALTVDLPAPETLSPRPIVCFAKPGGGYSRGYFTTDLPGPGRGAQAAWHAARGWVFVSVDHLGVGESSSHHDPSRLDFATVTAAAHAAENFVLGRLAHGTLHDSFPPVTEPLRLGIGQSMGGCLTVVQQARFHSYDGIGVLGYSAVHTHPPVRPGDTPIAAPWRPRDDLGVVLNAERVMAASGSHDIAGRSDWVFFHDDVDLESVQHGRKDLPWASATYPGVVTSLLTPGVIAPEAAAVDVPVLVAMGERDVIADPKGEPRAYISATSVDLCICPRMGHMHNFAGTRDLLWQRLDTWALWVSASTFATRHVEASQMRRQSAS